MGRAVIFTSEPTPPSDPTRFDVVVVGGGAIGLAIAWKAAGRGLRTTVIDPDPGHGASWAAAGMLAPITEVHFGEEPLLELNLRSQRLYPTFVEELERDASISVGYRRTGTLLVARDNDDNEALAEVFKFQQRLGLEVQRLRSSEVRELEPAVAPSLRGGIFVESDHQIDNRRLVEALLVACDRSGVILRRASIESVLISDGCATGVASSNGEVIEADQVVVCAGARSGDLTAIEVPVRPVKGQLLHLRHRDGGPKLERNIRGLDVYLVPRADGRLVVGATVEEQGYDGAVTAGGIHDLLRYAYELVPGITELELVEIAVGHRPGTPDNAPLIGPTSVDGLHVATGHYRNGILLIPVTAASIVELLVSRETPPEIAPFSPTRFARERQPI